MSNNGNLRTYSRAESIVFRKTKELYGGLSNMAPGFHLLLNGIKIWSAEALYQACRFPSRPDVQGIILAERSPMTAKMKSKPFRAEFSRPDWDQIKVKVMRWCLRVKLAQNWGTFSALLLSTGQKPIVEDSPRDDFWGARATQNGLLVGKNVLGRLLMELRQELKGQYSERLQSVPPPNIAGLLLLGKPLFIEPNAALMVHSEFGNGAANASLERSQNVTTLRTTVTNKELTAMLDADELLTGDFAHCAWQRVVDQAPQNDCLTYQGLFIVSAREAAAVGNLRCAALFKLLAAACSFHLRVGTPDDPFAPIFVSGDQRAPLPEDFSKAEFTALGALLDQVRDAELAARIGDLLWTRKRDHHAARRAIDSYLALADGLLKSDENLNQQRERCARALQLAALLGKGSEFSSVVEHIERYILARCSASSFAAKLLMDLLLEYRQGDATRMVEIANAQAVHATSDHAWPLAGDYYYIKAQWEDRLGRSEDKRASLVAAAESQVSWATECLARTPPSHIQAAEHLHHAIAGLREAGGQSHRIDELRRQLDEVQKGVREELTAFEYKTDLTESAHKAMEHVKQLRWEDALFRLANLGRPLPAARLRKEVEDEAASHTINYLFGTSKLDIDGRTIFRVPPLLTNDPNEREVALFVAMCEHAALERDYVVAGVIRPARLQVLRDHYIGERELLTVVTANPFVRRGHELLYARGLRAGLTGDFIVASHLLMPALEASIRGILQAKGMIVSGIRDGIQQLHSLNVLLTAPDTAALLGEDLVFNLRSLLADPAGDNLRNRALHGLAHQYEYLDRPGYEFAWWLTLHLCMRYRLVADTAPTQGLSGAEAETT